MCSCVCLCVCTNAIRRLDKRPSPAQSNPAPKRRSMGGSAGAGLSSGHRSPAVLSRPASPAVINIEEEDQDGDELTTPDGSDQDALEQNDQDDSVELESDSSARLAPYTRRYIYMCSRACTVKQRCSASLLLELAKLSVRV